MSEAMEKLERASNTALFAPVGFLVVHALIGDRISLTDFDMGAIMGVVLRDLLDAWRAYVAARRATHRSPPPPKPEGGKA